MIKTVKLLANQSTTGTAHDWPGGEGVFTAGGTFTECKLQFQDPADAWTDVGEYTTLSAAGGGKFILPNCKIRASLTGGSGVYANAGLC